MRRGIGAIVTTGVALVGATAVVANPVSAPPSDVRVPAVKLSADSSTSPVVLNRALLEVIAQDRVESSPTGPLKRLVADVVTDVTLLSGRAAGQAFWTEVPGRATPASTPSVPDASPMAVAELLSGQPANSAPSGTVSPALAQDRALRRAVTSVGDYVGYVSVHVVDETVAAARIATAEPKRIADTLAALTDGDVDSAIATALRVVAVPLGPPSKIVTAIRTVVRQRLTELADVLRRPAQSRPKAGSVTRNGVTSSVTSLRRALGHRHGPPVTTKPKGAAKPAAAIGPGDTKPTAVNGATDLSDGNKAVPRIKAGPPEVRHRVEASLTQARDSLQRFGETLRKAITPHRPHQRAGAGPASDAP